MKTIIDELLEYMDYATAYERKLIASIAKSAISNNCEHTKFQELRLRVIHRRVITRFKLGLTKQRKRWH